MRFLLNKAGLKINYFHRDRNEVFVILKGIMRVEVHTQILLHLNPPSINHRKVKEKTDTVMITGFH